MNIKVFINGLEKEIPILDLRYNKKTNLIMFNTKVLFRTINISISLKEFIRIKSKVEENIL